MLINRRKFALFVMATAALFLAACGAAAPAAPGNALQEDPYTEVPRVALEEARSALDAGSAIFLDVRAPSSYAAQHISGALNIPLAELEGRLGELDKAEWIITYCT